MLCLVHYLLIGSGGISPALFSLEQENVTFIGFQIKMES